MQRGARKSALRGAGDGAKQTDQRRSGSGKRVDVVADFLRGGMPLDGENFFAAHGVAGQGAVTKTGTQERSIVFGFVLQNVDDAAKIHRPDAEMTGADGHVGMRLQDGCGRKDLQAVDGQQLPGKQGCDCSFVRSFPDADELPHMVDAPTGWRGGAGGADVDVGERNGFASGEKRVDLLVTRATEEEHCEDRVAHEWCCSGICRV